MNLLAKPNTSNQIINTLVVAPTDACTTLSVSAFTLSSRVFVRTTHMYRIWLIATDLRSRFVSDMPSAPKVIIIAIGQRTPHWDALRREFPGIWNCCLDVRAAFNREWDESAQGTGFDISVRDRMRAKETWAVVFQTALVIAQEIGLVIIVCNHGKHRSLSVAIELASHTHGQLVSIRHQAHPLQLRDVTEFMNEVSPHLHRHTNLHSHRVHPIAGISVCVQYWDGRDWDYQLRTDNVAWRVGDLYLTINFNEVVIHVSRPARIAEGWHCGVLVDVEPYATGWFPPTAVHPIYFAGIPDFFRELMKASRQV